MTTMASGVERTSARFRFDDVNPVTGRAYKLSRFAQLPKPVAGVVGMLGFPASMWDAMVRRGIVGENVDCRAVHCVTTWRTVA
ncbi:hypothetical protein ACQPW3_08855 [Actinosynnema sp. CA-248983]